MFDYLINYGVKRHQFDYEDLDVNDRLMLQDQINKVRRDYSTLLNLLDEIQGKILECNKNISIRTKELIANSDGGRVNNLLNNDDEYIALEAEQQALKAGSIMVNNQIEFCKSDIRLLNSVFYNKF